MKCPYGPNASCAECEDTGQICHPEHGSDTQFHNTKLHHLSKAYAELYCEVTDLKVTTSNLEILVDSQQRAIEVLSQRCYDLEERERKRDRLDYDQEIVLDEIQG